MWNQILFVWILPFILHCSSISIDSIYLNLLTTNLSDGKSFNDLYRRFLQDVRQHRLTDIVQTPINLTKIRSNEYDEEYIKNSCYETASDLLLAHGFEINNLRLTPNDIQSLIPAILYTIKNPGCTRQSLPAKAYSFSGENFHVYFVWIFGVICLLLIKLIYFIIFYFTGDYCLSLTSTSIERNFTTIHLSTVKYRLWLGLSLNSFICGLLLGTTIYHLIPHIYDVPNETFDYVYLLRATILFFGIYLFFLVEKLLRFRFKIDEDSHTHENDRKFSDTSMIQMARMHGTFHATDDDNCPNLPAKIPVHSDSDDEENDLQMKNSHIRKETIQPDQKRNFVFYHLINDLSIDFIYGCGLAIALSHDCLIGIVLVLMISNEGFRRQSQAISLFGRKSGLIFLFISLIFLLFGYILIGLFVKLFHISYIYSIVYGALLYTALVTLIPEMNNFGQHLQIVLKRMNQTEKQRRLIKILILICQNLFLLIGIILILVCASIWRYYHRMNIYEFVCQKDSFRLFCFRS